MRLQINVKHFLVALHKAPDILHEHSGWLMLADEAKRVAHQTALVKHAFSSTGGAERLARCSEHIEVACILFVLLPGRSLVHALRLVRMLNQPEGCKTKKAQNESSPSFG